MEPVEDEAAAGPQAVALLAELQAVLEQASSALQAQQEGRLQDAVQVGAARPPPGWQWKVPIRTRVGAG